jgi:protein TonB
MVVRTKKPKWSERVLRRVLVLGGTSGLTLLFFLVLPLIQAISKSPVADLVVQSVDTVNLPPPPPPPPEEEPEEEPEPEEKPPELLEETQPLDLSQLELALNPGGMGGGWASGDFGVKLNVIGGGGEGEDDALFSLADLDQKPRPVYQPSPVIGADLRKKTPGTVYILFIVDQEGRVQNPIVQRSTDPAFERPALTAVKKWKFEPGKRSGKPVRFRMRVPITFPEG